MDVIWDPAKARSNRKKHGISFADIEPAFYDAFATFVEDPDAEDEGRYVLIGSDALGRIVSVVYTFRGNNIRLISARKATKTERREYEKRVRL